MLDAKEQGAGKFISGGKCTPQFGFFGRERDLPGQLGQGNKEKQRGYGLIAGTI
jgi:hypothetical protein